jgi:hypothetical protein
MKAKKIIVEGSQPYKHLLWQLRPRLRRVCLPAPGHLPCRRRRRRCRPTDASQTPEHNVTKLFRDSDQCFDALFTAIFKNFL